MFLESFPFTWIWKGSKHKHIVNVKVDQLNLLRMNDGKYCDYYWALLGKKKNNIRPLKVHEVDGCRSPQDGFPLETFEQLIQNSNVTNQHNFSWNCSVNSNRPLEICNDVKYFLFVPKIYEIENLQTVSVINIQHSNCMPSILE